MTTRRPSIDMASIDAAIEHLERSTGRTPSALALARRLGLANTTFRRRYPDIVARLQAAPPRPASHDTIDPHTAPHSRDLDRLRQRNRELNENLDLAVSSIQRLALENRALRQRLEELTSIRHLPHTP